LRTPSAAATVAPWATPDTLMAATGPPVAMAGTPAAQVEAATTGRDPQAAGAEAYSPYPADTALMLMMLVAVIVLPAMVVMTVIATVLVRRS